MRSDHCDRHKSARDTHAPPCVVRGGGVDGGRAGSDRGIASGAGPGRRDDEQQQPPAQRLVSRPDRPHPGHGHRPDLRPALRCRGRRSGVRPTHRVAGDAARRDRGRQRLRTRSAHRSQALGAHVRRAVQRLRHRVWRSGPAHRDHRNSRGRSRDEHRVLPRQAVRQRHHRRERIPRTGRRRRDRRGATGLARRHPGLRRQRAAHRLAPVQSADEPAAARPAAHGRRRVRGVRFELRPHAVQRLGDRPLDDDALDHDDVERRARRHVGRRHLAGGLGAHVGWRRSDPPVDRQRRLGPDRTRVPGANRRTISPKPSPAWWCSRTAR